MSASVPLGVCVSQDGPTATVRLSGELDLGTSVGLRDRVQDLLAPARRLPVEQVVLDLSRLAFIDVRGLGVLLDAEQELRRRGGRVELRSPAPMLRRMLVLLELTDRLPEVP